MNGVFDWLMFTSIAICIAVWPTQVITDQQNRWLRIVTIGLALVQILIAGPRLLLLPAYFVIVIFIVRLLPKKDRASRSEFAAAPPPLTFVQWAVIATTAIALLVSVVLNLLFPRA